MKQCFLKKTVLAISGVLLAQPALAGSLAPAITEAPIVAAQATSAPDWSGAYAGGTVGFLSGSSIYCRDEFQESCDANPNNLILPEPAPEGNLLGLTAGYNWRRGNIVYGVEADISKSSAEGSSEGALNFNCVGDCQTDILAAATLRGRVGFATGQWLPYATAGIGAMDVEVGFPDYDADSVTSEIIVVPVAGLGVEYMMNSGLSLKAEALYFFEHDDLVATPEGTCADPCGAAHIDATVVRFGVNYHF